MKKEDVEILVFTTKDIFPDTVFSGFSPHDSCDYESQIISHLKPMRRGDAERNYFHKQPIPYALLINPINKTVFAYKRASKKEDSHEERLHGKWSLGVGGHVESEENSENPIHDTLLRELAEEVECKGECSSPKVLGYINSEADDVSRVHFGVLYGIETKGDVEPIQGEIVEGRFMSLDEIKSLIESEDSEVEEWSRIAYEYLKTVM